MKKHKILPVLYFTLGFALFMFTRRSEIVPSFQAAIIIAPIFLLRFIRIQPAKRGILLTLIGFLVSMNIALWGLFKIDDPTMMVMYNIIRSSLLAVLYFLPYMADRIIYPKFKGKGILSTLIFPTMATAIYFLSSLEGPFDGDGIFSVYSYGDLTFKQLASITGLWGFVFIFSWFASIINYSWEKKWNWIKIKKITLTFSSTLLIILLYGMIKTSSLLKPESDTVRIASILLIPEDGKVVSMEEIYQNKILSPFEETISNIETSTQKAVLNKAEIVTFQEYAMTVSDEHENELIEQCKKIARNNNIYLSITYATFPGEGKGENKQLLINNRGDIEIEYVKRYLLGFGEYGEPSVFKKGPEVIQTVDTPYGRIGISICRDMSFPPYIRQAGKNSVDIVLGPSYDWPKSTSLSYSLRSIENGFSFVRPVYNGISFAVDYSGKVLTQMDSDQTEDGILYADVPTKGVRTLYSRIGDLFGWFCVLNIVAFIFMSIKRRNRQKA